MTHIPMGLRAAQFLFTGAYFQGIRAHMSVEQVLVLETVRKAGHEGITIIGIGRDMLADRSTIGAMVRTLTRWKYLYEIEHDGDARQKLIGITGMGKAALTNHLKRIDKAQAVFIRDLSFEEREMFADLLGKITTLAMSVPR